MDWLITTHSSESPLLPELGPNANGMALETLFYIATGLPISVIAGARNVKEAGAREMYSRTKKIAVASSYLKGFQARVVSDHDLGFVRGEVTEVMLHQLHSQTQAKARSKSFATSSSRAPPGQRRASQVTGMQLLQTLFERLVETETALNFDYLGLWMQGADLFDEMVKLIGKPVPLPIRSGILSGRAVLFTVLGEAASLQSDSRPLDHSIFASVVDILWTYIEAHGDKFLKAADEESRCVLASHMKVPPESAVAAPCADTGDRSMHDIANQDPPQSPHVEHDHHVLHHGSCRSGGTAPGHYISPHVEEVLDCESSRMEHSEVATQCPTMGSASWPWAHTYST